MLRNLWFFYRDGFRAMDLGRTLWKIVLIKVAVLLILANFILPNYLNQNFATARQRAEHVLDNLTGPTAPPGQSSDSGGSRD